MKKITLSIIVAMFAFAPDLALASPTPGLQSYLPRPRPLVQSKTAAVDGYIVSQVNGDGTHAQTTVSMRGDIYSGAGGVVSVSGSVASAAGALLIPSLGPGPGFSYSGPGIAIAIPQHSTTERIAAESKSLLMYGLASVRPSIDLAYIHTSGDMMAGGGENYVTVGGGLNVAYKDVFASVRRAAVDNGFAAAPNVYAIGAHIRDLTVAVGYVVPRIDMLGVSNAKSGEYISASDKITHSLSVSAIYVSGLKICEAGGVCAGIRTASANFGVAYPDDPTHPLASYDRGLSLSLAYAVGSAKIGVYGRFAPSAGAGASDTASLGLSAGVSF